MLHYPDDAGHNDQGWHKCTFQYKPECAPPQHYASSALYVPVVQCEKTTQKTFLFHNIEMEYIVSFQKSQRHRNDFIIYLKRQKMTCQTPFHPGKTSTKCSRGIQASTSKDFWLKSRLFLPVGTGKNLINCDSICILKGGIYNGLHKNM